MLQRAELKALHQCRMVPKAGLFLLKFASGLLIITQKRSRQSWRFFARNFPRLTLLCMNLQAIATATLRNPELLTLFQSEAEQVLLIVVELCHNIVEITCRFA